MCITIVVFNNENVVLMKDWMKQKYGDDLVFIVCFEDQLNNDYNSLFSRVNGA